MDQHQYGSIVNDLETLVVKDRAASWEACGHRQELKHWPGDGQEVGDDGVALEAKICPKNSGMRLAL
jgi:hypothetical protein